MIFIEINIFEVVIYIRCVVLASAKALKALI